MRIVIASPLYPPDVAVSAIYVKELAARLAKNNDVTAVVYGRLPEKISGAEILPVDKRRPLFIRLLHFFLVLRKAAQRADILYIENGPSVELPAGLAAFFTGKPLIIHIGDKAAHEYAKSHTLRRIIEAFAFRQAKKVIEESPFERPEILAFEPFPQSSFDEYERSWQKHLAYLEKLFEHEK